MENSINNVPAITSKRMIAGPGCIINEQYTVINGTVTNNVCKNRTADDQSGSETFVSTFIAHFERKSAETAEKLEAERIAEEQRIADIKERIKECESPVELAKEFGWSIAETADHWNDLHNGRSQYAVILSAADYEVMEIAKDLHNIEGEYGELRHRAGEHHSNFNAVYDLEDYQKGLRRHFNGDSFFYKSQKQDKEWFCDEIAAAASEGDMDKVQALVKDYNDLEDGYYDCNGNLQMLESDLESDSITGYSHDFYKYSFGFQFGNKYSFCTTEDENED